MQLCMKIHCVTPHEKGERHGGEREKWGTGDNAFAFDQVALLSQHITLIGSSMAICQQLSKICQLLMRAQWEKESHWMHLIDLKDDKNFTLQNRSVGLEGSKVWTLSVVPHFSLSPLISPFSCGVIQCIFMHVVFCTVYYPWGKLRDY